MKRFLLSLMTVVLLLTSNLQAQNEVSNRIYTDLQFMLMPSFKSIMMGNFNLGLGFQHKDKLGLGLGFHLDGIHLPNLSIISHGFGIQYRYVVNGIILKPEIGLSQLFVEKEDVSWEIGNYTSRYYFRQEITMQFNKRMTVGASLMVYPHNWAELRFLEYGNRSITYLNFHFGFTIYGKKAKTISKEE